MGSASQLVLAQRTYAQGLASGDVVLIVAAIRLARAVTLYPAPGWQRMGEVAPPDASAASKTPDPASETALTIARNLAGDDPDLQDLIWDLDAQLPGGPSKAAIEVRGQLGAGQADDWRVPLFGEVTAEIGLIGAGADPLQLTIQDETGEPVCSRPASAEPVLCRVTPARNGFFIVTVRNTGSRDAGYRLVGN